MKTHESPGRDLLRLLVWYPVRWLIQLLPLERGFGLLTLMGRLHYAVSVSGRKDLFQNLEPIQPEAGLRDSAVKAYFVNHYWDQLFILLAHKFTRKNLKHHVEIEGIEHLNHALQQGKGAILLHGHFGPAHLPLVALSLLGYPMNQIGNPSDEGLSWIGRKVAFRLRMIFEGRMPARIYKAGSFMRPVFKALQQNEVIMVTGDGTGTPQRYGPYHIYNFFNKPVAFPYGPGRLSDKTGAPLLPLFVIPGAEKRFRICIRKPLIASGQGETRLLNLTEQFIHLLENRVRTNPAYWHFLDRFCEGKLVEEFHDL